MSGNGISSLVGLVRTVQIIVGALTGGCVTFLVVVLVAVGVPGLPDSPPIMAWVAAVIAAVMVLLRLMIPAIFVARSRRKIRQGAFKSPIGKFPAVSLEAAGPDSAQNALAQVFLSKTILAAAILEGAVFLLLVAYLVEHAPMSLMLAVLLIVALALHVPTQSQAEGWLQDQTRLLGEERAF
jgi:hypothetical protein